MKFGRFDTKMNADLNFYPQKSQVFLSIAALVSGASLFIGFFSCGINRQYLGCRY